MDLRLGLINQCFAYFKNDIARTVRLFPLKRDKLVILNHFITISNLAMAFYTQGTLGNEFNPYTCSREIFKLNEELLESEIENEGFIEKFKDAEKINVNKYFQRNLSDLDLVSIEEFNSLPPGEQQLSFLEYKYLIEKLIRHLEFEMASLIIKPKDEVENITAGDKKRISEHDEQLKFERIILILNGLHSKSKFNKFSPYIDEEFLSKFRILIKEKFIHDPIVWKNSNWILVLIIQKLVKCELLILNEYFVEKEKKDVYSFIMKFFLPDFSKKKIKHNKFIRKNLQSEFIRAKNVEKFKLLSTIIDQIFN